MDKQRYERDGYLLISKLIDDETVAALNAEHARFDNGNPLSVQIQLVHRSAFIRSFVSHGPQVALAVEILGPNVCFTHQQYVCKAPDSSETDVPWHQDSGYGRLEPPTDLTVWIPLHDTDETNGCLEVLVGSHRSGLKPHHPVDGLRGADVDEKGLPVPMQAGDALLFGGHLMHRSLPNRSKASRNALYLRYCTPDVTMVTDGNKPVLEDGYSWMVAGEI